MLLSGLPCGAQAANEGEARSHAVARSPASDRRMGHLREGSGGAVESLLPAAAGPRGESVPSTRRSARSGNDDGPAPEGGPASRITGPGAATGRSVPGSLLVGDVVPDLRRRRILGGRVRRDARTNLVPLGGPLGQRDVVLVRQPCLHAQD